MQKDKMRVTILGCGGSGGVPYAGNVWGLCDPNNPKNARTRPSVMIEKGQTRIVIDTGPDFRIQLNRTDMTANQLLDAVLYTHAHFDHISGIDDLRTFWYRFDKRPVPVYGSKATMAQLIERFSYIFNEQDPEYPAIVTSHILPAELVLGDMTITHFDQHHGNLMTTGYRVGDFAYSTDVNDLPPESLEALKGVKTWVVGSFYNEEGTYNHAGFAKIREWVDILKPEMTYLTHLTAKADYDTICRIMPPHIRPAYDGLELWVDG